LSRKNYILLLFWLLPLFGFSQFSFLDDPYSDIEIEFLREKIEINPDESFFNVLKIKNPTSRRLQFNTFINLPRGWNLMVNERQNITLNPSDSILIPIRASAARTAKGEIGYAIVASLSDNKGKSFKNQYSFVNIPKRTNLQIRPSTRTLYINNATNKTEIEFNCLNKGNIDEVVYFEFNYDKGITMENGINQVFKSEFLLPPNSDTTIKYSVEYLKNNTEASSGRKNYRVHVKSFTKDTIVENGIWIKKINQNYENHIPDRNRVLIVELAAQNIFSDFDPVYHGDIRGSLLLKKGGSFYYRYQTLGKNFSNDPWKYSRINMDYSYKDLLIRFGDISESIDQSLFGRGGSIRYNINKHQIKLTATKNLYNETENAGILAKIKPRGVNLF
jgi:hypothetical protein